MMHTVTLCRVIRVSVLLEPERITHALKIIFTASEQEDTTDASCPRCPSVDEPAREE